MKIQVDGNIGPKTIHPVIERGAEMLVCGTSSLFKPDQDLEDAVLELRKYIDSLENSKV